MGADIEGATIHAWFKMWSTFFSDPIGQFMPLLNATGDIFTQGFSVFSDVNGMSSDAFKFFIMAPYNAFMKLLVIIGIMSPPDETPAAPEPVEVMPEPVPVPVPVNDEPMPVPAPAPAS